MNEPTANTVYCPECGTQNDEYLERCTACDQLLDPDAAAQSQTPPPRPMQWRTFGIMAGATLVLLMILQVVGLTFSMRVLPAPASTSQAAPVLRELITDDALDEKEARQIIVTLRVSEELRARLDAGELSGEDEVAARERARPADQSVVLGFGSVMGLVLPLLAFALAAIITAAIDRARRLTEVMLGAAAGAAILMLMWLVSADFEIGAVLSGEMVMVRSNLGFAGAPIMLLGMTVVLSVFASTGAATVAWTVGEQATGVMACAHCGHRFSFRPNAPSQCGKCSVPLELGRKVRYRGSDAFLGELGAASNPVTRASSGASELLCLACAKAYAADACPVHPHEPLLDPTRDEVKYQLLDLDTKAGTQRFVQWTSQGLGVDENAASVAPTGPLLCMACAKTYETEACPTHPHEPLLDPSTEAVRLELIAADDRARSRMGTMLMFGAAGSALTVAAGVSMALETKASTAVLVFLTLLTALVAVASVLTPKLAPPRYSQWTGESEVNLDEFGLGAESTLYAPIRRFLQVARRRATVLLIATVVGAGLGAGLGALAGWSIGGLAFLGGLVALLGGCAVLWVSDTARGVKAVAKDVRKAWDDPYSDSSSGSD